MSIISQRQDGAIVSSKVLRELEHTDSDSLPTKETACQVCPHAMWMEVKGEQEEIKTQVYCFQTNTIVWGGDNSIEITNCDGLEIVDE